MTTKTGSGGRPWVDLEQPKPPPVADHYLYWSEAPPERSPRCAYWVRQIERGWRPNKYVSREGYDGRAQWYGVWIWELLNVIDPLLWQERLDPGPTT